MEMKIGVVCHINRWNVPFGIAQLPSVTGTVLLQSAIDCNARN